MQYGPEDARELKIGACSKERMEKISAFWEPRVESWSYFEEKVQCVNDDELLIKGSGESGGDNMSLV